MAAARCKGMHALAEHRAAGCAALQQRAYVPQAVQKKDALRPHPPLACRHPRLQLLLVPQQRGIQPALPRAAPLQRRQQRAQRGRAGEHAELAMLGALKQQPVARRPRRRRPRVAAALLLLLLRALRLLHVAAGATWQPPVPVVPPVKPQRLQPCRVGLHLLAHLLRPLALPLCLCLFVLHHTVLHQGGRGHDAQGVSADKRTEEINQPGRGVW